MPDELDFDEIMDLQRKLASEVAAEKETDDKIEVMSIINDFTTGDSDVVQKEEVIIEAKQRGLNEPKILTIIDELKKDDFVIEEKGYLKKL